MTRKSWMKPPQSDTGRPGSVKATTLADVARPDSLPRAKQCRICLEPEDREMYRGAWRSTLKNGVCRNRKACEDRQPPLIPPGGAVSPYKQPEPLKQWCDYCQAATRTWTDGNGTARCARHDPESLDDGYGDDDDDDY